MEELIPLVNQLQEILSSINHQGIHLPQIVVVGSQSTGKSSVLENIVGRDFLPRGSDIVTRRPLILQLVHHDVKDVRKPQEWGVFGHIPEKLWTDFGRMREEIERMTNQVAGSHKNVSNDPIFLKIFSPNVLNLTLIDLPGMTKVPVGDQPDDIEERVRSIIMQYIRNPNSIILAVSAANVDLANSEALKLAKQVDPEGHRTIGVLTKLDLMDRGTNAFDILSGKTLPLKYGYFAIVNRSQKDIQDDLSIESSLRKEDRFFKEHDVYARILPRCGTRQLALALNKLLTRHIRDCLPEIQQQLDARLVATQKEYMSLGDADNLVDAHKGALLLRLLTSFASDFKASIDGNNTDISTTELYGGARIRYIFHDVFAKTLLSMDACEGLTQQDIRTAIRNASGPRSSLFVPETAFDLLAKRQIQRLQSPSIRCVDMVFEEVSNILNLSIKKELFRFPSLAKAVTDYTHSLLRRRLLPTRDMVEHLIAIELAYVNTNHPDFFVAVQQQQQQQTRKERGMKMEDALPQHNKENQKENQQHNPPESDQVMLSASQYLNMDEKSHQGGFLSFIFGGQKEASVRKKMPTPERKSSRKSSAKWEGDQHAKMATPFSQKEEMETNLVQTLMTAYVGIVKKNVQDSVPKSIMHFLVNQLKETLQDELIKELYKETLFDSLLAEDPAMAKKREECLRHLRMFQKASTLLHDIRDRDK